VKAGGGIGPGGGRIRRSGGVTEAAQARRGRAKFLPSFAALQAAVRDSCEEAAEWEARVAAGIGAVLDFAAADPEAALALTVRARRGDSGPGDREDEVIAYFTELLERATPSERLPASTDAGVVEGIATMVRGHLRAGRAAQLPALAPELVYMALLPYTGLAAAQRWADSLPTRQSDLAVHKGTQ
jgi:hypothetical protein